jgi:hypothetical protein
VRFSVSETLLGILAGPMENTQLIGENVEYLRYILRRSCFNLTLSDSEHSEKPWGRLASTTVTANNIDLVKERVTVGRASSNDVILTPAGASFFAQ